jgi:Mg-chelatase subunit ChlD
LFPCGREIGAIESKLISLPAGFSCSNCILQLTWRNSKDTYYSCSDVSYPAGILRDPQQPEINGLPIWLLYPLNMFGILGVIGVLSYLYKLNKKDIRELLLLLQGKETPPKEEEVKEEKKPETPSSTYDLSLVASSMGDSSLASPKEGEESVHAPQFTAEMEQNFMESIKKVIESKQTEEAKEFIKTKELGGKVTWTKTHFIFVLDCSGSMKGARWDSVIVGFSACLHRIKQMKEVIVSAFSFDVKPNPFCRERSPNKAILALNQIPFTGKGTDYNRALKYAIALANKSKHSDYLICIMFLSDGFGGYPTNCINELKDMRAKGKKILFYTIACDTEEESEMMKMANELQGEHYKVTDPGAAKLVFAAILNV